MLQVIKITTGEAGGFRAQLKCPNCGRKKTYATTSDTMLFRCSCGFTHECPVSSLQQQ